MGGKHLKKVRAEKSKVKLKQKNVLPKGQNLTNTSFKVKKIVTVDQLKKVDENEPVSSWNVPLKDLLIRLNHHNCTSRLNGLNGIKELVTNYPEILKGPSLRSMVIRILELLSDPEHKIRITAIDLINYIFSQLSQNSIIPFYDILVIHLSCAMTHREIAVQKDSIKFIDVINKYASEAVKKNFHNLIQNFARIIKIYFYSTHVETSKNLKSLETARVEMFLRFYQILAAAYSLPEAEKSECQSMRVKSNQKRFSLRSLMSDHKLNPDLFGLFKRSTENETVWMKSQSKELQTQCSVIMPLVFDTWAELGPNSVNDCFSSESVLKESVAELLFVLLNIILLLYEKIVSTHDSDLTNWFISTNGKFFRNSFVSNFPYLPTVSPKRLEIHVTGEYPSPNTSAYMVQNLIICYLFFCFKIKSKTVDYSSRIERYVSKQVLKNNLSETFATFSENLNCRQFKFLEANTKTDKRIKKIMKNTREKKEEDSLMTKNPSGVEILSKVAEAIINSPKNKRSDVMVATVVKAYQNSSCPELRKSLFKILMKVILEDKVSSYQRNQFLLKWIKTLPERLAKPRVPLYLIQTILKLISRPTGTEILKEVEAKAVDIIENLPNVDVEGADQFEGQKLIANILYRCSLSVLEDILRKGNLQKNSYPLDLRSYIIEIFSYRITNQSNPI